MSKSLGDQVKSTESSKPESMAVLAANMKPENTIVVGNLKHEITESILRKKFKCCDSIENIHITPADKDCKGVALIRFTRPESCLIATLFDGDSLHRSKIRVEKYKPTESIGDGKVKSTETQEPVQEGNIEYIEVKTEPSDEPPAKKTKQNQAEKQKPGKIINEIELVIKKEPIDEAEEVGETDGAATVKGSDLRTAVPVFVGNLPLNITKKEIKQMFKKFGKVILVCFRANTGQEFGECTESQLLEMPNSIAFVHLNTRDAAKASLALNGKKVGDKFITVDLDFEDKLANLAPNMKPENTVVVTNLSRSVKDSMLRNKFESCGDIEHIHTIRTRDMGNNCTIAFIRFAQPKSCALALKLNCTYISCRNSKGKRRIFVEKYKARQSAGDEIVNSAENSGPVQDERIEYVEVKTEPSDEPPTKKVRQNSTEHLTEKQRHTENVDDIEPVIKEEPTDEEEEEEEKAEETKEDRLKRAVPVFVENLPNYMTTRRKLMPWFKGFGKVISIRVRTNKGLLMPKRASQKKGIPSLIAFIYFDTREAAEASLALNGKKIGKRIITVDLNFEEKVAHLEANMKKKKKNAQSRSAEKANEPPAKKTNEGKTQNKSKDPEDIAANLIIKVEPKRTIVVQHLNPAFTAHNLQNIFRDCGDIKHIHVVQSSKGRNTAFIQFHRCKSRTLALKMNGTTILDQRLYIKKYIDSNTTLNLKVE